MHKNALWAIDDFFSLRVVFVTLLSITITFAIMISSIYLVFEHTSSIKELVMGGFTWLDTVTESIFKDYHILAFLLEHQIIMSIFHILLYFGVGVLLHTLFLIIYGTVVGLFSGTLIKMVQKKHFPSIRLLGIDIVRKLFFYVKTLVMTVLLFVLLIPLYFIPALNLIIFFPIYYFFHKVLVFDVASEINTAKEYKRIKKANWSELKSQTGLCFALTFIPVLGVLIYPFYIIFISLFILGETKELRDFDSFKNS